MSRFTFQGNEMAWNAVYTSSDLVAALLNADKGCPIEENKTIHFGKILGQGAGDAPVSEVTIDGYGTRRMVVKAFSVPVKQEEIKLPQTFGQIVKRHSHNTPEKLMKRANPQFVNKMVYPGDVICIPTQVHPCKTNTNNTYKKYNGGKVVIPAGSYLCEEERYSEYYIGMLCGKLFGGLPIGGTCVAKSINFIETFGFTTCAKKCNVKQYFFMERIDGTVRKSKLSNQINDSLYAQLVLAIEFMQKAFSLQHGDLHTDNMFYQKITKDTEYGGVKLYDADYFEYRLYDTKFFIPNKGYILKVGDFGISVKYSFPLVGNKTVIESGYKHFFGFFGIPNAFTKSYDLVFSTGDMKNHSPLANKVFDMIQQYSKHSIDPKFGRPYPVSLDYLDTFASPTDILLGSYFEKFREKPSSGKIVLVGEIKC